MKPELYNVDARLGIKNLDARSRRFFKVRQRKAKPRHLVYSTHIIMQYQSVNSAYLFSHEFVVYYFVRDNDTHYWFCEVDYINLHPHDIKDMYHYRISHNIKTVAG